MQPRPSNSSNKRSALERPHQPLRPEKPSGRTSRYEVVRTPPDLIPVSGPVFAPGGPYPYPNVVPAVVLPITHPLPQNAHSAFMRVEGSPSRDPPSLTNPASLKTFRPELLAALNPRQSRQCATCGLRFSPTEQMEFDTHMDEHFQSNQLAKSSVVQSRGWYLRLEEWVHGVKVAVVEEAPALVASPEFGALTPSQPTRTTRSAVADDSKSKCGLCGDAFVKFWSEELEQWRFKDAVPVDDIYVHAACAESHGIQITAQVPEVALNSNEEIDPELDMQLGDAVHQESRGAEPAVVELAGSSLPGNAWHLMDDVAEEEPKVNGNDDDVIEIVQPEGILTGDGSEASESNLESVVGLEHSSLPNGLEDESGKPVAKKRRKRY